MRLPEVAARLPRGKFLYKSQAGSDVTKKLGSALIIF
jgi:hypothetical protein